MQEKFRLFRLATLIVIWPTIALANPPYSYTFHGGTAKALQAGATAFARASARVNAHHNPYTRTKGGK
jgi:hypothetical protein